MFNSLLTNDTFKQYYKVESTGAWAGIVTSMYQIGGVAALPFIGPACDTWGRRYGMMIGGAIASAGVIIQATTKPGDNAVGQFMGGRLLLGFGVPILTTAGPLHVIETAHPAHRGVITGLYNTFWYVQNSDVILIQGLISKQVRRFSSRCWCHSWLRRPSWQPELDHPRLAADSLPCPDSLPRLVLA